MNEVSGSYQNVAADEWASPLEWSDELSVIAAIHADVVANRQTLTHKAPREGHLRQRLSAANLFRDICQNLVSAPSTLEALRQSE